MEGFKVTFNNGMEDYNKIVKTEREAKAYVLRTVAEWVENYFRVDIMDLDDYSGMVDIATSAYTHFIVTIEIEEMGEN